jgi:hypothetical protein
LYSPVIGQTHDGGTNSGFEISYGLGKEGMGRRNNTTI